MIDFNQALEKILAHSTTLGEERLPLQDSLGCVLSQPIISKIDSPIFDNSAVDGFGVKIADLVSASQSSPKVLQLIGTSAAGADENRLQISPGTTVKILTGAPVPAGVEAVVMREFCQEGKQEIAVGTSIQLGENIRTKGAEFKAGQQVLASGIKITPPVIGLLAALGYDKVPVYKLPKVGILVTGDELVEPGNELKPGQIYNANAYALQAAIEALKFPVSRVLTIKDNLEETKQALQLLLQESDVVVSTGGVSMGDYDYVKDAAESIGMETIFWKISIKPGKPVYFAKSQAGKFLFGLPGNPVSTLVTFHQLVKPALLKMSGERIVPFKPTARLAKTLCKRAGRMEFVRGQLKVENNTLVAQPTVGQDSHMLTGLAMADGLIWFERDSEEITEGQPVTCQFLNWWQ